MKPEPKVNWFLNNLKRQINERPIEETLKIMDNSKPGMKRLIGSLLTNNFGYGDVPNIWEGSEPQKGGIH